jgi:hypothetical protein
MVDDLKMDMCKLNDDDHGDGSDDDDDGDGDDDDGGGDDDNRAMVGSEDGG